jgi:hypothetical protein
MKSFAQGLSALLIAAIIAGIGFMVGRHGYPKCPTVEARTDTVIVRDTIRIKQQEPVKMYVVRTDTIRVKQTHTDTVYVEVEVPIERKVYATSDYRAEIEGFRPALVSMEIYRQTQFIDRTQTIRVSDVRRWGFGLQAGYGMTARNGRTTGVPFVGVGVSYDIMRW